MHRFYFLFILFFMLLGCDQAPLIEVDFSDLPLEVEAGIPFLIEDYVRVSINSENYPIESNDFDRRINYNRVGDYVITLNIASYNGRTVNFSRTFEISVVDTTPPKIIQLESQRLQINQLINFRELFYCDDFSRCEIINVVSNDVIVGENVVTVVAEDEFGNRSVEEFMVFVGGVNKPSVTLEENFIELDGTKMIPKGYSGESLRPILSNFIDSDPKITYLSMIDTQRTGYYLYEFYAEDSDGFRTDIYSQAFQVVDALSIDYSFDGIQVIYTREHFILYGRLNNSHNLGRTIGINGENSKSFIAVISNGFNLEWHKVFDDSFTLINDVSIMDNGDIVLVGKDSRLSNGVELCSSRNSIDEIGFIEIFSINGTLKNRVIEDVQGCESNYLSVVQNGNYLYVHSVISSDSRENTTSPSGEFVYPMINENIIQVFDLSLNRFKSIDFRARLSSQEMRWSRNAISKMDTSFTINADIGARTHIILTGNNIIFILSPFGDLLEAVSPIPLNISNNIKPIIDDVLWCSMFGIPMSLVSANHFVSIQNSVYFRSRTSPDSSCNQYGSFVNVVDFNGDVIYSQLFEGESFIDVKAIGGFPFGSYRLFTKDGYYDINTNSNQISNLNDFSLYGNNVQQTSQTTEILGLIFPNGYGWGGESNVFAGYISREGIVLIPRSKN
jgi:hypothetical protein